MANLKEIALGLTAVLQFGPEPEPLGVDLRGQSTEEATFLLKSIIDECVDGGIALKLVRIDPEFLGAFDAGGPTGDRRYRGIIIQTDQNLDHRIEFYRFD